MSEQLDLRSLFEAGKEELGSLIYPTSFLRTRIQEWTGAPLCRHLSEEYERLHQVHLIMWYWPKRGALSRTQKRMAAWIRSSSTYRFVTPAELVLAHVAYNQTAACLHSFVLARTVCDAVWYWPFGEGVTSLPQDNEPGAFGTVRRHDRHTGVDLPASIGQSVYACEGGRVMRIERFVGEGGNIPPWSLGGMAVMVEGASGGILYGGIHPDDAILVNAPVRLGQRLGVIRGGCSVSGSSAALHLERYSDACAPQARWESGALQPDQLLDPTPLLAVSHRAKPGALLGSVTIPVRSSSGYLS